jgi:hypothetical protein
MIQHGVQTPKRKGFMRPKYCVLFLLLAALCPVAYGKSHRFSSDSKPVHVDGYYRKDGTYVRPHDRSLPGASDHTGTQPAPPLTYHPSRDSHALTTHQHTYRRGTMAQGYTPHPTVQRDSHGRIRRSTAAKNAFKHDHPCPATGRNSGSCPGYVIDHVNPLECGGADAPSNMHWQTIADGKAKDKTERYCR